MQAAIDVGGVAGGEGDGAREQPGDGPGHVAWLAPAADRGEAITDALAVAFGDRLGHRRPDDAGADLVDRDAVLGEAEGAMESAALLAL